MNIGKIPRNQRVFIRLNQNINRNAEHYFERIEKLENVYRPHRILNASNNNNWSAGIYGACSLLRMVDLCIAFPNQSIFTASFYCPLLLLLHINQSQTVDLFRAFFPVVSIIWLHKHIYSWLH